MSTVRLSAVSAALAVLLIACASPGEGARPTPSPTPSSTLKETIGPEEQAIAAYEGLWDTIVEASREPSADHPDLDRYAAGEAAEVARLGLRGVVDGGQPFQGDVVHDIEVLSADSDTEPKRIELRDCMDGADWKVAEEIESADTNIRVDATVERDALTWQVVRMRIWEPETC